MMNNSLPDHVRSTSPARAQQGMALLTILIMVVLATLLAVSIFKHQQASLDETRMLLRQDQALMYAQSAEYFFSELLVQDAKDNQVDNLNENWAKPFPMLPLEDGYVSGQIEDENGKFNLNTLLNSDGSKNTVAVAFFQAMLTRLEIDPQLVEAVIDWQDTDSETVGAMGAENNFYQGTSQGYLAPNTLFSSIEQLQMVRGFAGQPYQKLKPYITALPSTETKINLNTTSAFILSCLSTQLEQTTVANTLQQMHANLQTFESFSALWKVAPFSTIASNQHGTYKDLFALKSSYFTANITVNLSDRQRHLRSHLYRRGKIVQSYQRSWVMLPASSVSFK